MGSFGRRTFMRGSLAAGGLAGLGDLSFLSLLRPLSATELTGQQIVRFRPEIEPLVELLEQTPRADVLQVFADRIQQGICLLYTSPSPRDVEESRMPSSA